MPTDSDRKRQDEVERGIAEDRERSERYDAERARPLSFARAVGVQREPAEAPAEAPDVQAHRKMRERLSRQWRNP